MALFWFDAKAGIAFWFDAKAGIALFQFYKR